MRLIDADAMIERLEEWNTSDTIDKALYNFTMHRIYEQPTIEPEPPQICNDCTNFNKTMKIIPAERGYRHELLFDEERR